MEDHMFTPEQKALLKSEADRVKLHRPLKGMSKAQRAAMLKQLMPRIIKFMRFVA